MDKVQISGIYCIVNKVNEKYYVGSARSIIARRRDHGRALEATAMKQILLVTISADLLN